ncbi:hypothetical protein NIES4071_12650 [Calothrix sp. NIES-4071]|nr:hypothetical protein NIES4071_12650 [Calothrix sp. NIES-4071]BAZ55605.1 hypothetical protein NIES4105_12610 [Calothrix sp. NIES-4105]
MNHCPCCSHVLLRHIRGSHVYWFCRNCWQTMPVFEEYDSYLSHKVTILEPLPFRARDKQWEVLPVV